MPLPWKKARISRFFRIMADLHPSKPCSSMVVETGFPTSLVDLFVKNCDRLKKPIKKKKKHHLNHQHHHFGQVIEELVKSDPVPLSSSKDLTAAEPVYVNNKLKRQHNFDGHRNIVDGFEILGGEDPNHFSNQSEKGCGDSGVVVDVDTGSNKDERCVLFAFLKMFVVVILALITKKLTIGITMSAFFLLFLEYVGKHILCFLQPCSTVALQPLIQLPFVFLVHMRDLWVCNLIRLKSCLWVHEETKEGLIIEGEDAGAGTGTVTFADDDDLLDRLELNSSGQEIQVAEARFDTVGRAEAYQCEKVDLLARGRRWGRLDMLVDKDESEDVIHEEERHHSHKIRRKIIKKLVPKKLRAMKKARKWKVREEDGSSEVSSHGEDKLCGFEETEEQDNSDEKENSALWQLVEEEKEGKCEEEKREEIEIKTSDSSMELQTNSEMFVFEKVGNRGSLLLLIVLAGLVGGRILALGLTVVSCFIIQLVWRRPRRCINKSSASMSS